MAEKSGIGQLISQAGGRSVWQVLVLYMGASWGVLEVVDVAHRPEVTQRFVEQDGVDVGAHQSAAQRDLLFAVGGQPGGTVVQRVFQIEHLGDLTHPAIDLGGGNASPLDMAQGYATIANGGHAVKPYVIDAIYDAFVGNPFMPLVFEGLPE